MVFLGYNLDNTNNLTTIPLEICRILAVPYEILEIWKTHISYFDEYMKFCKIVSNNTTNIIPFRPPKTIWSHCSPDEMYLHFNNNYNLLKRTVPRISKYIETLFNFEISYIKIFLSYYIRETTFDKFKTILVEEIKSENPCLNRKITNLSELENFAISVENCLFYKYFKTV